MTMRGAETMSTAAGTSRGRRGGTWLALMVASIVAAGCERPMPTGALAEAAAAGDLKTLTQLLATARAGDAAGALVWAARKGRLDAIRLLLDRGADPNQRDGRHHWTPLMHALHTQHPDAARLLLERGADAALGTEGNSPLEMATLDNDLGMMALLLAKTLPPDQKQRALAIAVSGGALVDLDRPLVGSCRPRTVRRLLASDPDLPLPRSMAPLAPAWFARLQGCREVVAMVTGRGAR